MNLQAVNPSDRLPALLWLWLPIGAFLFQLFGEWFLYRDQLAWVVAENGPYEIMQVIIISAALIVALITLIKMDHSDHKMVAWIALAAVCCLYVAGEEVSWGQHIADWATPDYWNNLNDQGETNLHNTTSWLDQKPRLILTIGVYLGGLIIPLLLIKKPEWVPKRFEIIYPTREFAVVALICLVIKVLDKIFDLGGEAIFMRNAENEEQFLFYFVLLYLLLMKKRLVSVK